MISQCRQHEVTDFNSGSRIQAEAFTSGAAVFSTAMRALREDPHALQNFALEATGVEQLGQQHREIGSAVPTKASVV